MKKTLTGRQRGILWLIVLHVLFVIMVLGFNAYLSVARGTLIGFCAMKEFIHIYCPFCGGTRAFGTLFVKWDLLGSLAENPTIFLIAIRCVILEITAIYAIIRKKDRIFWFVKNEATVWVILFAVYFVIRNIAVFVFHYDPLGDIILS